MMVERRHPAVFAGLTATAVTVLPFTAFAATAAGRAVGRFPSIGPSFVAGCALGALGGSVATYLIASRNNERREEARFAQAFRRTASQGAHAAGSGDAPEPEGQPARSTVHSISWGTGDYDEVAENYVRKQSIAERMAMHAKGVADVLSERLAGNEMDGVPVIRRADGSVGDVGTGWWDTATGAAGASGNDNADAAHGSARTADTAQATARKAQSIAQRVAPIDEGLFPAHREVEDLPSERDVWEVALAALEERSQEPMQGTFDDVVGGPDTLDEPAGLEPATSFIPFRLPAGHPEVVDTDSYIDYLINDEFSRNPSHAARDSSKSYLTLIEGGSQKMPRHAAEQPARSSRRAQQHGKHFAKSFDTALEA